MIRRFPTTKQFEEGAEDFERMVKQVRSAIQTEEEEKTENTEVIVDEKKTPQESPANVAQNTTVTTNNLNVVSTVFQQQKANKKPIDFQTFFSDGMRDSCVITRARPILPFDRYKYDIIAKDPKSPVCSVIVPSVTLKLQRFVEVCSYDIDATFNEDDDTGKIYRTVCQPLVMAAMSGISAAIVAYGQTGSGKTYTTQAIMQLLADDLVSQSMLLHSSKEIISDGQKQEKGEGRGGKKNNNEEVMVTLTCIEMMGDKVKDLMTEKEIQIFDDPAEGIVMRGVERVNVQSRDQLLDAVQLAGERRRTRVTTRNEAGSSRTHMAIQLRFATAKDEPTDSKISTETQTLTELPSSLKQVGGILTIVDLAGSESAVDTEKHDRERIKESKQINTSLMTLKDCIRTRAEALTSTKHVHIPYRSSRLTLLLKDAFDLTAARPAKTILITCVSPVCTDVQHTCNTLKYAEMLCTAPPPIPKKIPSHAAQNPLFWTFEKSLEFLSTYCPQSAASAILLGKDSGRNLASVPEKEFVRRAVEVGGLALPVAKSIYLQFWEKLVDARSAPKGAAQKVVNSSETKWEDGDPPIMSDLEAMIFTLEREEREERSEIKTEYTALLDEDILMHMGVISKETARAANLRAQVRIGSGATQAKLDAFQKKCFGK